MTFITHGFRPAKNLDTFWCTACNCHIIFRCARIHGRAGFIKLKNKWLLLHTGSGRISVVSDVRERVRDFRITFALYVKKIFINWDLFNLFWHTDKNLCFYAEVNFWDFVRNDNSNKGTTAQLNETRFGPKKSRPQYISAQKISTLFDALRDFSGIGRRERVRDFRITFALYVKKIFINWVC
jgi:hypothetical protein